MFKVTNSVKQGIKKALGIPAIGLGLSMFTFGAFLKSSDFSMLESFLSTFFAFALPGQFVMADMLIAGGNLINVFLAVLLTNLRLLPMTINMMPILENKKIKRWKYYLICHLIAVTAWINMLIVYKNINKEKRFQYFFGLGCCLWITSIICTVFGFVCSNFVNEKILIGLVFFNPMYFLVMTLSNIASKKLVITIILSIILGPLLYNFNSNWGILFAGFLSGTIGFLLFRKTNL